MPSATGKPDTRSTRAPAQRRRVDPAPGGPPRWPLIRGHVTGGGSWPPRSGPRLWLLVDLRRHLGRRLRQPGRRALRGRGPAHDLQMPEGTSAARLYTSTDDGRTWTTP